MIKAILFEIIKPFMQAAEQLMEEIVAISRKIKEGEPAAITPHEQQAAIALAALEKTILTLVMAGMLPKIIFLSLFYFWLMLEAPIRGVSEEQLHQGELPLPQAISTVISIVQSTLKTLPDYQQSVDKKALGNKVDALKMLISDDELERELSQDELVYCTTHVNTLIHTVTSYLLGQSFHPEIISNVLFGYWLRLSTLHGYVYEPYYQKMEHYFNEIHTAVRKQVPALFN